MKCIGKSIGENTRFVEKEEILSIVTEFLISEDFKPQENKATFVIDTDTVRECFHTPVIATLTADNNVVELRLSATWAFVDGMCEVCMGPSGNHEVSTSFLFPFGEFDEPAMYERKETFTATLCNYVDAFFKKVRIYRSVVMGDEVRIIQRAHAPSCHGSAPFGGLLKV